MYPTLSVLSLYSIPTAVYIRSFFFFNATATTEIYTLSLHDALPISTTPPATFTRMSTSPTPAKNCSRSEEHTSELQSRQYLVCRLLLEKKKQTYRDRSSHACATTPTSPAASKATCQ